MKKLKITLFSNAGCAGFIISRFSVWKTKPSEYIDVINWEEYPYKPIVAFDIARTDENLYIRYFVKGIH